MSVAIRGIIPMNSICTQGAKSMIGMEKASPVDMLTFNKFLITSEL